MSKNRGIEISIGNVAEHARDNLDSPKRFEIFLQGDLVVGPTGQVIKYGLW